MVRRMWMTLMPLAASATVSLARADTNNSLNNSNDNNNNIHAMIVSSSRYWFNYRHAINALGMYQVLRNNGIPDENIILMLADEYATNARNPYKNRMHGSGVRQGSWYSKETQVDYRGSDVTVQNFLDALLGVAPKALQTDADSNVLVYVTGHGGDQFFKFQDEEELTAQDIANLLEKMHVEHKYNRLLFIADTCQAFTLFDKVTAPNVLALGSSLKGENAYAHHSDKDLGLAVIERWTHAFLSGYDRTHNPRATLHEVMVAPFASINVLAAQVGTKEDTSDRKFAEVKLSEFFGVKNAGKASDVTASGIHIVPNEVSIPIDTQTATTTRILVEIPQQAMENVVAETTTGRIIEDKNNRSIEDLANENGSSSLLPGGIILLVTLILATVAEKNFVHR